MNNRIIGKNTKLKLTSRIYFDEDKYLCSSYKEALDASANKESITTLYPQNCYLYEYNDFDNLEKEDISYLISGLDIEDRPESVMYLINAKTKNVLMISDWIEFQKWVDCGLLKLND